MKKKLMLLGGIRYLLPVIEAAHKLVVNVFGGGHAKVAELA